jgi:hypothetical protein
MPPTFAGLTVNTQRKGNAGYILFELAESQVVVASLEDQPNRVQIEYGDGYAKIGMRDRYTIRMLRQEFCALIGYDWSLYDSLAYKRLIDGTIRHHTVTDYAAIQSEVEYNVMFDLPERIQIEVG